MKTANRLIESKSPYLLQHAYNPVDWYEWGPEALDKAVRENKPILVSIGYSACHWCHVMEHESFEDEKTAKLMNDNFVCIKIDREERPDLDNLYMDAVQAMGLNGGWPLNVFLMPDQKPFYGGTYFPNQNFKALLKNIAQAFDLHYEKLAESAEGFAKTLAAGELEKYGLSESTTGLSSEDLEAFSLDILRNFDFQWGGLQRSPKFPMPSIWDFLLAYSKISGDQEIGEKVFFTLRKIGMGGIYDHVGGGFARYSVDSEWFAPHFEKMLYDNGQLLSLYAKAYQATNEDFYKEKIQESVEWLKREMLHPEGGLYAALDADSEGEEGKFYTWKSSELEELLKDDYEWFKALYNIKETGNWEEGANILFQTETYREVAKAVGLTRDDLATKLNSVKALLLQRRAERPRPGLDDKILSGWNGLAITGLLDAYLATGIKDYKELSLATGKFIKENLIKEGRLFRAYKDGKAYNSGFLEDYAAVIEAFVSLYPVTADLEWIHTAKKLADLALEEFFDPGENLFFFNNPKAEKLIANKKEIFDNVIPSSNAKMARNLHALGLFYYEDRYLQLADKMLKTVQALVKSDPAFMSQWALHYLEIHVPTAEVAIVGEGAKELGLEFLRKFPANAIVACSDAPTDALPLLAHKTTDKVNHALIYVCFDKTCKQPVSSVEDALTILPKLH